MDDTQNQDDNRCQLKRQDFQRSLSGKQTDLYILRNNKGTEIAFTNYGAAILAIMVPDKEGNIANVILGHDSLENVINSPEPFLNTTIGRYGNRIAKGKFKLDGKEYNLTINNGPNSLHGGPDGFHRVVWEAHQEDKHTVILMYESQDGEEGFPGKLTVTMKYRLDDENRFIIDYEATTDKKTIVNLTNHAFFNLSGIAAPTSTIENHLLTINSDFYIPIDETSIPTGEICKVIHTPMDFRTIYRIGERINDNFEQLIIGHGYDHCYVLNKTQPNDLSYAAKCIDPITKRTLEVYTTEPGVQLYTGNWLNGFKGAHGATFPARSGVCFEAQHFPDSPNRTYFPSVILTPEETYRQTTIYKFGVE